MNSIDTPSSPGEKVNPRALLLFFIFYVLVLIFIIYYFQEIRKDFILLGKINGFWLILAIAAQIFTYFFSAAIYRMLLSSSNNTLGRCMIDCAISSRFCHP
jgi:energy-coupling factor transporter transmembrane protein EcfT